MLDRPPFTVVVSILSMCLLPFSGCGGSAYSKGGTNPSGIALVTISPQNFTLSKGNSIQMSAIAVFKDETRQDITASATWSVSAPVASVTATGKLTAITTGNGEVSAQYQDVKGVASVVVSPAVLASIFVTSSQSSLPIGESEQLNATGTFSDGSIRNLTQMVTWVSSLPGVVSINATGVAAARALGTTMISASVGSVSGSVAVTAIPAEPVSLVIVPGTLSLVLGGTGQLRANATLSDGTTQDLTADAEWTSSQSEVLSISTGGLATAQQIGSAIVTAVAMNLNATSDVSVVPIVSVNRFDLKSAQHAGGDGTIRITNPGLTSGDLCAMFYVFDENQEMSECCGCTISDSGLRSLSLVNDLTSNPLIKQPPLRGSIKLVPSDPASNPQCNPASLTPSGAVIAWGSNIQTLNDGTFQVTESKFNDSPLSEGESDSLTTQCSFVQKLGSGRGICSCGTGH